MTVSIRPAETADWPAILEVAHAAVPWAPESNRLWAANRQGIHEGDATLPHYVALDDDGEIVGYGAVEGASADPRWRLFLVAAPEILTSGVGSLLYGQLVEDATKAGCTTLWMREEAGDASLLAFAAGLGFNETERFKLDGDLEVVVIETEI